MEKSPPPQTEFINFNKLAEKEQSYIPCSFGDPIFDTFMKGGLRPGLLTEICGEAGSGKSQLAFQIMLYSLLNKNRNQICHSAFFISTQKPLNETRINQLRYSFFSKNKITNKEDLDKNLILKHATNITDFNHFVYQDLVKRLEESNESIRLVVIDSIAGICNEFIASNSKGYSGVDTIERKNFLLKLTIHLKKIASKHDISILILNNMSAALGDEHDYYKKEKLVPALGLLWSNMIHERYQLKKKKSIINHNMSDKDLIKDKQKRIFKVKFSCRFGKKKMEFVIENEGVIGTYTPTN